MAKKKSKAIKTCLQTKTLPVPGSAGPYGREGQYRNGGKYARSWYTCREDFHNAVRKPKDKKRLSIYFGTKKPEALGRLIRYVESRLNIKYINRTRIHRCAKDDHSKTAFAYIEMSPFWPQNKMRLHFFTLLLRAVNDQTWKKPWTNPLDIILNEDYFHQTPLAVARFLSGYTCFTSPRFPGWRSMFADSSHKEENIGQMYKPKSKRYLRKNGSTSRLSQEEKDKLKSQLNYGGFISRKSVYAFLGK